MKLVYKYSVDPSLDLNALVHDDNQSDVALLDFSSFGYEEVG